MSIWQYRKARAPQFRCTGKHWERVVNTGINSPKIHLWVYNHPLVGISDQIDFLLRTLKQHGYRVSISRNPRLDALNVVIENFSEITSNALISFCRQTGKRIAVIMTEHLDMFGNQLLIHGEPLWNDNDYMHPATQVARIKNLMDCVPYLRAIFVLGDLPQLSGSDLMFPGLAVRSLPFPFLERIDISEQTPKYNFVFTGNQTAFRKKVLQSVGASHSLLETSELLSRKFRDNFNASAKIVLNVPQRSEWRWLSLMRIIAALQRGRATVSIETEDTSWISRCCIQLSKGDWVSHLEEMSTDWQGAYSNMYENYELMRQNFLDERGFPFDVIENWALFEKNALL